MKFERLNQFSLHTNNNQLFQTSIKTITLTNTSIDQRRKPNRGLDRRWIKINRTHRHLSDLSDCIISNTRNIARQIFISSLKSLLPKPRQPDPTAVGIHIPHMPHHLLPLLHFLHTHKQNIIQSQFTNHITNFRNFQKFHKLQKRKNLTYKNI